MMATFDLQEAVVQRVQNAVHSLKKELETAGWSVDLIVMEEIKDGITVRVEKARKVSRGPVKVESVYDLPEIGLDENGGAVFLENEDDGGTGDE